MSSRDGNREIYVMDADGSFLRRLTHDPADDTLPAFSPDGTRIAFTSYRDGNAEIYLMNLNGTNQTNVTNNNGSDYYPAFSPDGTKIAFASSRDGDNEIFVMDANGANQTNITQDANNDFGPAFSPDGTKITFMSLAAPDYDLMHVNVMDVDGANQADLTPTSSEAAAPTFSPDGSKIAFTQGFKGQSEIFEMNADGSNQVRLTSAANTDKYDPAFSPNSAKIVFTSSAVTGPGLSIMNADGSSPVNIASPLGASDPSWGDVATTRSTLSLSVIKGRTYVKAKGLLEPASAGNRVTVRLFALRKAKWVRIGTKSVSVKRFGDRDHDGRQDARYLAVILRPPAGRYRITSTFGGDWDTFGSLRTVRLRLLS